MNSPLLKQLEHVRFHRALEVASSLAENRALLTTQELERMNQILTGKESSDPWRKGPVELKLPSGRVETLQLIQDPKLSARESLHRNTEMAELGDAPRACLNIYTDLVLAHPFIDANRRTAVLAAHYVLARYGIPLTGTALHDLGLGDLRDPTEKARLEETFFKMIDYAKSRKS